MVQPIVERVVHKRINGSVIAYGQTTSGKTYTMLGSNDEQADLCEVGLLQLALEKIFEDQAKGGFGVRISYLEIYNESIFDLLTQHQTPLKLVEGTKTTGDVKVQNLSEVEVNSIQDAVILLRVGEEHRTYR